MSSTKIKSTASSSHNRDVNSERCAQRRASIGNSNVHTHSQKELSMAAEKHMTNRRHSLAITGEASQRCARKKRGQRNAGTQTDSLMRSDSEIVSLKSNKHLKPILKYGQTILVSNAVTIRDPVVNDCKDDFKSEIVGEIRCCYRLPVNVPKKVRKTVSFREDLVYCKLKHLEKNFASP